MESMRFIGASSASLSQSRSHAVAKRLPVELCLVLLLTAASCGSQPASGHIEGSRVKAYSSIHDLSADSQAIVVVVATNTSSTGSDQRIPYTVTLVSVRESLKGSVASSIKIRQFGSSTVQTSDELDPLLASGTIYVLFLSVFTYGPGQDTDQYVVVGGSAGMFTLDGTTLRHVRGPDPLPQTLSLSQLRSEI